MKVIRILLAEENTLLRGMLVEVLEKMGYVVNDFGDGESALAQFNSFRQYFQLVISDYIMSGVDGLELCRLVKKERPDLPVIIMSGSVDKELPALARQAGASIFFQKGNLRLEVFRKTVMELVGVPD